jgi:glycosyltransferase involved in cell wall biosynthesis
MANLQQIIDIDQMVVLHNLIEPAFYQDSQVKSGGKKAEGIIFLNIASLSEAKNHHLLLRAFASKFKGRNAFLRIGGIGPLKGGIESLALELGIAEQVNFLGLLSRDDVRNEMVFADAFVLSSSFETFGVVLIEAMVCGLPIIATDCGGPVDIVNIDNGLLVESDNISALAEAMQKISDTYHLYDPSKLRSLAIERFGEEAFLHNLMKFYSETE